MWSRVGTGSTTVVRPCGVEPREQNARLDLRARDRELVADAVQLAALDDQRRLPVVGLHAGAHQRERLRDAFHRPAPERLVAGQLEAAFLADEDPGEQAQRRARVAAVDRALGLAQAAQAGALDADRVDVVLVHGHAEPAHRGDRGFGVGRAAEALDEASRRRRSRRRGRRGARSTCRPAPRYARATRSAGSIFIRPAPARRRRRSPATRAARPPARPRLRR